MKLYIHIRNLKPPSHSEQDSCNCEQDNMTFHSVFLSTHKQQEKVMNPTVLRRSFSPCWTHCFLSKVIEYQHYGLWTLLWPIKQHIPQVEQSRRHGLLTEICTFQHSLTLHSLFTWISQVLRKECDVHCLTCSFTHFNLECNLQGDSNMELQKPMQNKAHLTLFFFFCGTRK